MSEKPLEELTPRQDRYKKPKRKLLPRFLSLLLLIIVAIVLVRTLNDASLFFHPVDEAVEKREELGDRRFRIIGTPQPGISEVTLDNRQFLIFTLCVSQVYVDVLHEGDPAELFSPGVPVVLQGSWKEEKPFGLQLLSSPANDGWHLRSDSMVVKHDNDYRADGAELESCQSE